MTTRGKIINIRNVDIIDGFLRKTAFAVKIGAARGVSLLWTTCKVERRRSGMTLILMGNWCSED
mgnify:CR=1 FL=1